MADNNKPVGLRQYVKAKAGDEVRDALPMEHFALDSNLRFFLEIFLMVQMREYVPQNEQDEFFAAVSHRKEQDADEAKKITMHVSLSEMLKFPIPEQMYVLAHEAGHILLGHLLRCDKFDSPELWNLAVDGILNSILNDSYSNIRMPHKDGKEIGITVENLKSRKLIDTPKKWQELTAEEIYSLLDNSPNVTKVPTCSNCGNPLPQPSQGQDGEGQGQDGEGQGQDSKDGDSKDGDSKDGDSKDGDSKDGDSKDGDGDGEDDKGGKGQGTKCPHCGKNHKGGGPGGGPGGTSIQELDRERIDNHDHSLNPDDLDDDTRHTIEQMLLQAKNGTYGDVAGNFVRQLLKITKKNFPFNQVLDPIIYKEKYNFNRPSRRVRVKQFPSFIPNKRMEKFKIYAGLDVSGSTDGYIEDFLGYILALPEFEEVVYCDTQIQHIIKKDDPIPPAVPGLGGTDLNPMLYRFEEHEKKKRAGEKLNFILLTDGVIPPIEVGPKDSLVIVFTTQDLVEYAEARRKWMNIQLDPDELGA